MLLGVVEERRPSTVIVPVPHERHPCLRGFALISLKLVFQPSDDPRAPVDAKTVVRRRNLPPGFGRRRGAPSTILLGGTPAAIEEVHRPGARTGLSGARRVNEQGAK